MFLIITGYKKRDKIDAHNSYFLLQTYACIAFGFHVILSIKHIFLFNTRIENHSRYYPRSSIIGLCRPIRHRKTKLNLKNGRFAFKFTSLIHFCRYDTTRSGRNCPGKFAAEAVFRGGFAGFIINRGYRSLKNWIPKQTKHGILAL